MSEFSSKLSSTGKLFALGEPNAPTFFGWGEGKAGAAGCAWQKFYAPRDRASDLWSGFSLSGSIAHVENTNFSLPQEANSLALGPPQENRDVWKSFCAQISAGLERDQFRKVVPARAREFHFPAEERPTVLNAILRGLFSPSATRVHRFFLREKSDVFFGASPELLFRREGDELFVPAIAGTRSVANADELLRSPKEREEHAFVVEGICAALTGLGLTPRAPAAPDLLQVPGLVHLFTPISASGAGKIPAEDLIRALHPTPAVGGWPKKQAQDFLLTTEPWDRGLFASPLYFRFPKKELCVVAIRSGLLRNDSLHLFAGAGFVAGSTAEGEWAETGRKMSVLQSIFEGKNL